MGAFHSLAVVAAALATTTALSACDIGQTEPVEPTRSPAADARPPPAETVRNCRTAVYGKLAPSTRKNAVTAGPVSLLAVGGKRPAEVEPSGAVKVLVLIQTGETATVVVPEGERERLSLLYDLGPGPKRSLRLSDGTFSARFNACTASGEWAEGKPYPDERETQFNGAFFVRGAHCAMLNVWIDGRAAPSRLGLGFGVGRRPCPEESAGA
jgi:hypothetical protein